ncbi:FecR domain-containing protein [Parabacteroides faecis]|uniref:FecR family protein n=1 Tax=Parabacteroides faecis TaxID=1217282 RepID=UPI0021645C20|nr:FecR family protein [Parabacteroides faecis]MCS2891846.1 FecR domain-containing protein [Parabacteroides faecis]UVQ44545.1 FecR domain-containing protein [Parabacteroides faecis]
MDTQKHIDEQALLDYFSGTLSPVQKQEVEAWIQETEENRKIARDIEYIYFATDTINTIKSIDSTKALKEVKVRFSKKENSKRSFILQLQRIAAIFVIPLLISTLYYATKEEPVEFIEIRTNPGMVATVNLPDGSKVWLNSRSYLKHPQKFTGDTRNVEMEGEAYFSVQKDKSKKFIVNTPFNLKAEVLGTEFNMEAYKESNKVVTTLISGSVRLSFQNKNNTEETMIMKPNDEISYNSKTRGVSLSKPYLPTLTAWKDGLVIFRNTPFEDALNVLSKRFNVEFIVKNDLLYENSFTGPFDGQHLHLILEHFRLSSGIQYKFVDPETGTDKISEKTIVELY